MDGRPTIDLHKNLQATQQQLQQAPPAGTADLAVFVSAHSYPITFALIQRSDLDVIFGFWHWLLTRANWHAGTKPSSADGENTPGFPVSQ